MFSLLHLLRRVREYNTIVNIEHIARRYFVMNAFDGVLTTLGILLGTFLVHTTNTSLVISATIGAAIALGVSGVWGAYLTEHAERRKELKELERMLYTKLKKTKLGRATRAASIILAAVNGIAPFLAAMVIILPFFFASRFASLSIVYYTSFSLAFLILIALGIFLGNISKENLFKSAAKMVTAGIFCAAILLAVDKIL
jgi:predicted membrane protein (TIGR00267 family)